jgi:hypothetical protein
LVAPAPAPHWHFPMWERGRQLRRLLLTDPVSLLSLAGGLPGRTLFSPPQGEQEQNATKCNQCLEEKEGQKSRVIARIGIFGSAAVSCGLVDLARHPDFVQYIAEPLGERQCESGADDFFQHAPSCENLANARLNRLSCREGYRLHGKKEAANCGGGLNGEHDAKLGRTTSRLDCLHRVHWLCTSSGNEGVTGSDGQRRQRSAGYRRRRFF